MDESYRARHDLDYPAAHRDQGTTVLQGLPVRFRILGLLFVLSFVNYLLRNNLSVALPSIHQEFGFSNTELGWIGFSFSVAYALFQVPGGVFGDVFGPRRALTAAALAWGVLTALTGFLPGLVFASATGVLAALMGIRFLLGVSNAPIFPVAAGTIASWFPVGAWAFPNAVLSSGLTLGQAAVGPLVAVLVTGFGWRQSFYMLAPVGLVAAAWWWWYGRDKPAQHRAVTPEELALIDSGRREKDAGATRVGWTSVLRNRDVVLLAASYFSMNYTFYIFSYWLITYLVEERGFSLLEGGLVSALPFLVGAVLAAAGGMTCDALCRRIGPRWGCRLPGIIGLVMVAWFLLAGAASPSPVTAVLLLALCFGFTQFTEGAYWQGTTYAAGPHTATACGVLNTGGNLAGFLSPVVGMTVDRFGWWAALATGSGFALLGALLWLFINAGQPRGAASGVRVTIGT
jgi:ACS family glucarate transporter-like MFS transporter